MSIHLQPLWTAQVWANVGPYLEKIVRESNVKTDKFGQTFVHTFSRYKNYYFEMKYRQTLNKFGKVVYEDSQVTNDS